MKLRSKTPECQKNAKVLGHQIRVKVNENQLFVIKRKAEGAGVSISEYLRHISIHGKIVTRLNEEDRQLFRELVALSNEIRKLVKIAEEEGARASMLHFTRYGDQIDVLINRFSHD